MMTFRYSWSMCCIALAALVTTSTTAVAQTATAVTQAAEPKVTQPKLITRIYDISDLTSTRPQFPYTGDLPGASPGRLQGQSGAAFNPVGGGGGMGGAAGGGGFFSVPAAGAQMGGGGMGGGMGGGVVQDGSHGDGMGGFSGGMGGRSAYWETYSERSSVSRILMEEGNSVADLLMDYVATDTWEDNGGTGTIREIGSTLLVHQTAEVHAELVEFLQALNRTLSGQQNYQLEVWWLPLSHADRHELDQSVAQAVELPQQREFIRGLSERQGGYHGRLRCVDHTVCNMTWGIVRPGVVGQVPVVGNGASELQPIVRNFHIGIILEAAVDPVADHLVAAEDVGKLANVRFRSILTDEDSGDSDASAGPGIDRFRIPAQVTEGVARLRIAEPTIIGSLTSEAIPVAAEESTQREVVIVMLLSKLD